MCSSLLAGQRCFSSHVRPASPRSPWSWLWPLQGHLKGAPPGSPCGGGGSGLSPPCIAWPRHLGGMSPVEPAAACWGDISGASTRCPAHPHPRSSPVQGSLWVRNRPPPQARVSPLGPWSGWAHQHCGAGPDAPCRGVLDPRTPKRAPGPPWEGGVGWGGAGPARWGHLPPAGHSSSQDPRPAGGREL